MASYLALLAEATNAISGVVIVSCLLLVTMLILRWVAVLLHTVYQELYSFVY